MTYLPKCESLKTNYQFKENKKLFASGRSLRNLFELIFLKLYCKINKHIASAYEQSILCHIMLIKNSSLNSPILLVSKNIKLKV